MIKTTGLVVGNLQVPYIVITSWRLEGNNACTGLASRILDFCGGSYSARVSEPQKCAPGEVAWLFHIPYCHEGDTYLTASPSKSWEPISYGSTHRAAKLLASHSEAICSSGNLYFAQSLSTQVNPEYISIYALIKNWHGKTPLACPPHHHFSAAKCPSDGMPAQASSATDFCWP